MKREAASCCILSSTILCHTLIRSCVLLLESWNLHNSVGIAEFNFTWEWHIIGSPPADFRNWAVRAREKEQTWLELKPAGMSQEVHAFIVFFRNLGFL